jgi:phage shock protein PspC (stress-responsive transcriptional regulator)
MFFQLDYTIIEIIVIITIIFPILDMFLLFYLRSSIP